jgi:capsid protein
MTLKESITRQGYDPAQVLAEIGVTNAELDVLGIVLDTDPRWATKTRAAVASAERIGLSRDAEGVSPSKTAGSLPIDLCE